MEDEIVYTRLIWTNSTFSQFDIVSCKTIADGSCLFHAICKAYIKPYITQTYKDKPLNRHNFVRRLRKDLSKMLAMKSENGKTFYEQLSNGELAKISKDMPDYSLENMQKELDSDMPLSNLYNEFISDQMNIDIYILDALKKDVYMTGTDDKILYKGRRSVVILYTPGHYELVGLIHSRGNVETFFSPDSPFILKIRERMQQLQNS